MQPIAHFALGVVIGTLLVTVLDRPINDDVPLLFASGLWAMIPDFHWAFRAGGASRIADLWHAVHSSPVSNLFWLHRLLDQHEPANARLAIGAAVTLLAIAPVVYRVLRTTSPPVERA